MTTDTLQRFLFEGAPVRGELVEISQAWRQMLRLRDYPPAVQALLGEMVAAAALLTANLKFNGVLVMQIHGDGPVQLLVVECDAELKIRATAKLADKVRIAPDAKLPDLVNRHGKGRFVITLDPQDKMPGQQAYQGIVPLEGETVATVIEHYMTHSEQLDTRLWLAADGEISRGLLLQKLPGSDAASAPEDDLDTWQRSVMLASTLSGVELLTTDTQTLLHRLFWEEAIRLFEPAHPRFQCSCTRDKVGNMLRMLGEEEIDEALEQLGELAINCDFCGQDYAFDKVDCAQLFATEVPVTALPLSDHDRH